jgi:polar amino acid transport system substrate-binding protein
LVLAVVVVVVVVVIVSVMYFAFPRQKPRLRVGTSPDFLPFEYIDEAGNIVGIDIDLIKAIASKLGYEDEIVQMQFSD